MRLRALRLKSTLVLCALTASWSTTVHAGDITLAESLFREGQDLMAAHDYAHACPKLEESYRQDPGTGGVLLALALCYEAQGKLASAWSTFGEAAARLHTAGRTDSELEARKRGNALEPRLSKLTVAVGPDTAGLPGLSIRRDGQVIPGAAWGSAVPVDGGEHIVEAVAEGRQAFRQVVSVANETDAKAVHIPALAAAPVSVAPAPAGAPPPATPLLNRAESASTASSPSAWTPLRISGVAAAGAGVVALAVGTVFAFKAKGAYDDSNANGHCDASGCDPSGLQSREDAFSAAGVSTAFFITGAVLAAGGAVLYLVGPPTAGSQTPAVSLSLVPEVARNGGGLLARGAF